MTDEDRDLRAGLLRLGVAPEAIEHALEHGRLEDAIFEQVLGPRRQERTVSARDIESAGGLTVAEIQESMRTMGLPAPEADQPWFTSAEADVFTELGRVSELWPPEVRLQMSRLYGQALGRVAQVEVHVFRSRIAPILRESSPDTLGGLAAVAEAFARLLPLADPMLLGVHRRKIEQELTQAAVWEVELEAEGLVPGSMEVSLVFCDLRHFTSYANVHGDAAAMEMLDRFGAAVEAHQGESGRLVKSLGDGFMLAYRDPGEAVAATIGIFEEMGAIDDPRVHAGIHHGVAVFRDGDYFGRAVNLASRLLAVAHGGEILATEAVARGASEHPWKALGARTLRGFPEPLEIFSLKRDGWGGSSS